MWQGMQRYELLSLWYNNGELSDVKSALLFAISGFDPITEKKNLDTWLEKARQQERLHYLVFQKKVYNEKLIYWLSWV